MRIRQGGDEHNTAFHCQFGHFEYCVDIFRDIIDIYVVIYLDDILVFSNDINTHRTHVSEVLSRLATHRIYAKLSKCSFHIKSVEFLGFIISSDGLSMASDKVEAVKNWIAPKTTKVIKVSPISTGVSFQIIIQSLPAYVSFLKKCRFRLNFRLPRCFQ